MAELSIRPATHARFDDLALVIGPKRADASVCWCLSHRIDAKTNLALRGSKRGAHMEAGVSSSAPASRSPRRPTPSPAASRAW